MQIAPYVWPIWPSISAFFSAFSAFFTHQEELAASPLFNALKDATEEYTEGAVSRQVNPHYWDEHGNEIPSDEIEWPE